MRLSPKFREKTSRAMLRLASYFSIAEGALIYGSRYIAPDFSHTDKEDIIALHEAAHAVLHFSIAKKRSSRAALYDRL